MPTTRPLCFSASFAVGSTCMSFRSFSNFAPAMPCPTMLSITSTRVLEVSMMRVLKSSKVRQPELPGSTTVVTPVRNVNPSGEVPRG